MNHKFLPAFAITLSLVFSLVAASSYAGTLWRQYGFNPAHTSFNDNETILTRANVSQLTFVWSGNVGRAPNSTPILGFSNLFAASGGHIVALKAQSGERRWGHLSCSGDPIVHAALGHGILLVGDSGGDLAGYNPSTGNQVWCDDESGSIVSAPAVMDDTVYITNGVDAVALNQFNGQQRWRFTAADFNPLTETPAIADGVVYVTGGNAVFALDQETGKKLWRTNLGPQNNLSAPSVAHGIVYVGGNALYALSGADGHLIWKNSSAGVNVTTPAIAEGKVFVSAEDPNAGQFAFNATTGSLIWSSFAAGESEATITVANGVVYAIDEFGDDIVMLNSDDGSFLGSLVDPDGLEFSQSFGVQVVVANGTVYIPVGDFSLPNRIDAFRLP